MCTAPDDDNHYKKFRLRGLSEPMAPRKAPGVFNTSPAGGSYSPSNKQKDT